MLLITLTLLAAAGGPRQLQIPQTGDITPIDAGLRSFGVKHPGTASWADSPPDPPFIRREGSTIYHRGDDGTFERATYAVSAGAQAVAPGGDRYAVLSNYDPPLLEVFDERGGKKLHACARRTLDAETYFEGIEWSGDGRQIALRWRTAAREAVVQWCRADSGEVLQTLVLPDSKDSALVPTAKQVLVAVQGERTLEVFSPRGAVVVRVAGSPRMPTFQPGRWSYGDHLYIDTRTWQVEGDLSRLYSSWETALVDDGRLLACSQHLAYLFDPALEEVVATFPPRGSLHCENLAAGGGRVLVGLSVYDERGRLLLDLSDHERLRAVGLRPDGQGVVTVTYDGEVLALDDAGRRLWRWSPPQPESEYLGAVVFLQQGAVVAVAGGEDTLLLDAETGALLRRLPGEAWHASADEELLLLAVKGGGQFLWTLYDAASGALLWQRTDAEWMQFSRGGREVLATRFYRQGEEEGFIVSAHDPRTLAATGAARTLPFYVQAAEHRGAEQWVIAERGSPLWLHDAP